jgi:long-chain acyl-CoA synthetase
MRGIHMENIYSQRPWRKNYDKHIPSELRYENKTFVEMFKDTVSRFPDKTAVIYLGRRLSFRELDTLSDKIARYLADSGVKPGDVIGMHMPNIPAHYISIIAVQKAGCISTGLSPLLTPAELTHQINDSGSRVIFTVDVLYEKIREVAKNTGINSVIVSEIADFLPGVKRVLGKLLKKIPTAPVNPIPGVRVERFPDVLKRTAGAPPKIARSLDDPIFMMYTGGTTGPAKGAVLTHRSVMSNRTQVLTWLDADPNDMYLCAFPLFHIAGLFLNTGCLSLGITQIAVPNPRDSHFMISALKAYKPTSMVHVTTVFLELMKQPEFRKLDFSGIKWCMSAAAPFPPENIKEFESIVGEGKLLELYGMTETSPVMTCLPRFGKKKPGSIGMPMPDTDAMITDPESGKPVPPGEAGEICIRGPQLMTGYYNKPEETAHALRDGWMHTGDIGKMDEDGYFYIVDRLKDMVNVSGFKVFTRELDDVLSAHPDVDMAAFVGIPDPDRPGSERVAGAIVLKQGIEKTQAEKDKILLYLRENVAPYKVPKQIEFLDQLPTSGVGKILKRELRILLTKGGKSSVA